MKPETSVDSASVNLQPHSPVLERLLHDHSSLRVAINAMEEKITRLSERDPETLDLLASLIDYVAEYPDRVHHPREDRIMERLVDKGLTPGERAIVELTVAQHAELAAATARLELDMDAVLGKEHDANDRFDHDVGIYLAMQKEHMRREEQHLFPLAIRLFSEADWREIEAAEPAVPDPLRESRLARYSSLLDLIDTRRSGDTPLTRG